MAEDKRIKACPYCGSVEVVPKVLFGGPLPGVDANDGTYVCEKCGREAVPLHFRSFDDWYAFFEADDNASKSIDAAFAIVPIVPINTAALFSIRRFDFPIGKTASVVSIVWQDSSVMPRGDGVSFETYWEAIFDKRYNASAALIMDVAGITEAKPNFKVLKDLTKRSREIWLDIGMRSVQDLFDCFTMGVSRAIVSTLTSTGLELFNDVFELSDKCLPCMYFDGEIVWAKKRAGPSKLKEMAKEMEHIGYDEMAVVDLRRLGTGNGVSRDFLVEALACDLDVYIGGGVVETDLEFLREEGAAGAFIDPHTAVIRSLFEIEGGVTPTNLPLQEKKKTVKGSSVPID
ncbi:MAG: HisA/HisF-related TIM barrel protein [Methanomassiliicoccales archaeon]|jgi:uncharacterized protein related to proFAR isomerase/DNA-directed RNA polymerase subunit RPC12/RpoP|nr:HisA/HisF-related TIM barrel protein [Methanomassiliicoccales archaeon]